MKIEFDNTGNAAFEGDCNRTEETVRILRKVADAIETGWTEGACMDINGNRVGTWQM